LDRISWLGCSESAPDAVLLKNEPLYAEQRQVMRRHPEMGAAIIGEHAPTLLQMARRVALTHHEKWDGIGYPQGLQGGDIALEGRIVTIADVFDALTNERPYKAAWPVERAIELLRNESGRHFDPALVQLFIKLLPEVLKVKEKWPESSVHAI